MARSLQGNLLLSLVLLAGCAGTRTPGRESTTRAQTGIASYYGTRFHGGSTASGRSYDSTALTAAHRTLPFGTRVRVTNLSNGRKVIVTITDRGPFRTGRIIDVSDRAARILGFVRQGVTRVRMEVLGPAPPSDEGEATGDEDDLE